MEIANRDGCGGELVADACELIAQSGGDPCFLDVGLAVGVVAAIQLDAFGVRATQCVLERAQLTRLVRLRALEELRRDGHVASAHHNEGLRRRGRLTAQPLAEREDLERAAPMGLQPPLGVEDRRPAPRPRVAGPEDQHSDPRFVPRRLVERRRVAGADHARNKQTVRLKQTMQLAQPLGPRAGEAGSIIVLRLR